MVRPVAAEEGAVSQTTRWTALQTMSDLNGDPEEERHAAFYQKPWVEEAVWKYLSDKVV